MSGTRAISTTSRRELSSGFFSLQGKAPKEIHAILTETLAFFLPARAKDLSAPLYGDWSSTSISNVYTTEILAPLPHCSVSEPRLTILDVFGIVQIIKRVSLYLELTQRCAYDKIEKNEMGWACGAYG